MVQWNK